MKHKYVITFLALVSLGVTEMNGQGKKMIIQLKTGESSAYALEEIRTITFPESTLLLKTKSNEEKAFLPDEIDQIVFDGVSGLNDSYCQSSGTLLIYPNPAKDYLTIDGLENTAVAIRIYRLDGTLAGVHIVSSVKNTIDINPLAAGFYIMQINGKPYKFRKS